MPKNNKTKFERNTQDALKSPLKKKNAWGAACDALDQLETEWILETYRNLNMKKNKS